MSKVLLLSLQGLVAVGIISSIGFASEKPLRYGGFSPDSLQVFYDYIHRQKMMKVQAGDSFYQSIRAIPVQLETSIDLEQEAGLRSWLYDFLVAFSESGSDSLVAAFYTREGANYPRTLTEMRQHLLEDWNQPVGESPFDILSHSHKYFMEQLDRDYYFGGVSFYDSVFRVFDMTDHYETYESYAAEHGMIPRGRMYYQPRILPKIKQRLARGETHVFAEVMFIVEEPEEFMKWEVTGRTPTFFRLVWDEQKLIWRHIEVLFSYGIDHVFLFL